MRPALDWAAVGRLVLLAALAVVVAGCGDSLPGGKVVTPTPVTVIGTKITVPGAGGNAPAGKTEFTADGCNACHTFTAAGAKGTIGPNLDDLAAYAKDAKVPLEQFIAESITSPPPPYVPPPYPKNVMQPGGGHTLTAAQLSNLVAFLAKSH